MQQQALRLLPLLRDFAGSDFDTADHPACRRLAVAHYL
jgi:hypothetical protein